MADKKAGKRKKTTANKKTDTSERLRQGRSAAAQPRAPIAPMARPARHKPAKKSINSAKPARNAPPPKAPAQPQKPISPRSRRAVNRAMNSKRTLPRRRRRLGGNYILYYLLAAIVVVAVFVILANTLLFNCSTIEAEGCERYTEEEIVSASGLAVGDNLLHIDTEKAEQNIVESLAYIDMAEVTKLYPTRIKITVTEAEKWFCVEQDGITVAVSRGGKIVEQAAVDGLVVVKGYEAETMQAGAYLTSLTEGKNDIPEEILNAAEKAGLTGISEIDITDRFDITAVYDNRIILEIGNINDIETKLTVAATIIKDELSPTEEVTILLTNPEKIAVRSNAEEIQLPEIPDYETSETAEGTEETSGEAASGEAA